MYHQLYESTQSFGCLIANFCHQLQWIELSCILKEYAADQLSQCETAILAASSTMAAASGESNGGPTRPLTELTNVRPSILAAIYTAGFTTPKQISEASVEESQSHMHARMWISRMQLASSLSSLTRSSAEFEDDRPPDSRAQTLISFVLVTRILRRCRPPAIVQIEDEDSAEYQAEVGARTCVFVCAKKTKRRLIKAAPVPPSHVFCIYPACAPQGNSRGTSCIGVGLDRCTAAPSAAARRAVSRCQHTRASSEGITGLQATED